MSVSEISHDQSEKSTYTRQFFGGILHFVQNDVVFCHPSGRLLRRFASSQRQILLPPSGEVARSADRGPYVILSVSEISHRVSTEYVLCRKPPSREITAVAMLSRNDTLFYVILSMPSKQTCLQGFANEDIHKALAFLIKNAKNESFNAQALSAE